MEEEEIVTERVTIIFELNFENVINPVPAKTFEVRIAKDCALGQVIDTFCWMHKLPKENYRFRYLGGPIKSMDTPISLGIEEGDFIDIFRKQQGSTAGLVFKNFHLALQILFRRIRHCQILTNGFPVLI
ncbi:Oidioi.mRNA.OKI2018_I69.chr1.g2373.t1.cds [Oikopleura dioica]|uniref:Oidioi.mRNA.OKI2018_I69.chr1.g2373.t1.cds n=1 Tax=Oikopleura dioica TaxID=34765 RepID=A0ABN7SQY1_OIKDI|nr:Oidioi.mRNA.OKI2018_I69.chr1.g2373.t1.cds [Oikopleura dioica]